MSGDTSGGIGVGVLPLGNVLDGVLINNVVGVMVGDSSTGMVPIPTTPSNVISGNLGRGIEVRGQLLQPNFPPTANTIQGNYIGTDASGHKAVGSASNAINYNLGNLSDGIFLFVPSNTEIENNLISNNRASGIHAATQASAGIALTSGTITIQNNYIGTDVTGTKDTDLNNSTISIGNGSDGVFLDSISTGATIQSDVISGNRANGINLLDSSNVTVVGNYIGTNFNGTNTLTALGNDSNGIFINGSSNVTVGGIGNVTINGLVSPAQNIISGNLASGVLISGVSLPEFPISTTNSGPTGITTGPLNPDGTPSDLWFTETGANKIGEINPTTGIITDFATPTTKSGPTGITLGPDGNLWFTETNANQIGMINPTTDLITEFAITTANSGPTGITTSVGNLWFTETNANQIGEINPTTGAITEFAITTANSGPTGITASAGNLWFTETKANKIGEFNPTTDAITEYVVPTTDSGPTGITADSVGNLWFTENDGNQIGGINSRTDVFQEFAIPTPKSGPTGITLGAAGNLWFTETLANQIGRFNNSFHRSNNLIEGNLIGLGAQNSGSIPNHDSGVVINQADNNTIGGTATGAANVISGNLLYGVLIASGGSENTIEGNDIGTGAKGIGNSLLGNTADGVFLLGGNPSDQNETVTQNIVSQNVISGNDSNGVQIFGQGSTENTVSNNLIGIGINATFAPNLGNGVFLNDAGPNNTIGAGNVIAGNDQSGVMILSDTSVHGNDSYVEGNYIGTDANNTPNIGNGADGVFIYGSSGNTIGGTAAGARNVISGNDQSGVVIFTPALSALADNNQLIGNQIGINSGGTSPLPNQSDGVEIINSMKNTIGPNNVISGNLANGVLIESLSSSGSQMASQNVVFGNKIGTYGTEANLLFNGQNGVLVSNSSSNTIGGVSSDTVFAANVPIVPSNVISGNGLAGIQFFGNSQFNVVQGNYIGVDADGSTIPVGNQSQAYGVYVNDLSESVSQESIGGTGAGQGNLISGNGVGIQITGPQVILSSSNGQNNTISNNAIQGNVIGLGRNGSVAPNGTGIYLENSAYNTIGGTTNAALNVISGNITSDSVSSLSSAGIQIFGTFSTNNLVIGNYIGTGLDGTGFPQGEVESNKNQSIGVLINGASGNTVGGTGAALNVISGNDIGVEIAGLRASLSGAILGGQDLITGNLIGLDATGTTAVPNFEFGVLINNSGGNTIGPDNVISTNGVAGIELLNPGSTQNLIVGNQIGTDIYGNLAFQPAHPSTAVTPSGITVDQGAQIDGVVILGASGNTVGATKGTSGLSNYIAGNVEVGVFITSRDNSGKVYPVPLNNSITGSQVIRLMTILSTGSSSTMRPTTSLHQRSA